MSLFRLHYPQSRSVRDAIARVLSIVRSECGARARNDTFRSRAVPGIMRSATTSAPWGAPLDWDRRGRVTPASTASDAASGGSSQIGVLATSQETWPEVARSGRKPASQSRGGTPIGVHLLLEARPCEQHGRLDRASVGVPYPFAFASFAFAMWAKWPKRTGKSRHHPFFSFSAAVFRLAMWR